MGIWPREGIERLNITPSKEISESETTFSLGHGNPSLWVVPLRRAHPGKVDSADGNWIDARITAYAGMLHGDLVACLRSDEIESFRDGVRALLAGESITARYESMEYWLKIELTKSDSLGHFSANCQLRDRPGSANQLNFKIETDFGDVKELKQQLDGWLEYLPVIREV